MPTQPDPNDTQGLYQPGWDGTDLNDTTLTQDGKLIASGDDYGCVRLHNDMAIQHQHHHQIHSIMINKIKIIRIH